jgi:hypothetical protein
MMGEGREVRYRLPAIIDILLALLLATRVVIAR